MSKPKSAERLLCEDYCKQYPKMKTLTLAKKIFVENHKRMPKLKSIEHTRRTYVNEIRGLNGELNRKMCTDKSLFQPATYDTANYKPFKEEINTSAKILVLDIETAPGKAYIWDVWNQNISADQIESDWFCLTWAAKWLFEKQTYSQRLTSKEALNQDDKRIMKGVWTMLNEADIVIAHNGEKFDIPRLNTRFLIHKMPPPMPYEFIDTLKHLRRQFDFFHNKLDYVNKRLGLTPKRENGGFELWKRCMAGEEKALIEMDEYNVGDIIALEEDYLRIRSWIKPHPNIGLYILDEKKSRCPSCGCDNLKDEGKNYHTIANVYGLFRCDNCDSVSRQRLSKLEIKQRRHLTLSVPK